ncbi:MAG: hypothetical protein J7507_14175 [Pseudoxanthomonas sp.]|nr:hypothetical protein [Pseudoxanthomonas sp.]
MTQRLLVVRKDLRGCTLLDRGRPLAWYPSLAPALALARTLADATALREGSPAIVEVCRSGQAMPELAGS